MPWRAHHPAPSGHTCTASTLSCNSCWTHHKQLDKVQTVHGQSEGTSHAPSAGIRGCWFQQLLRPYSNWGWSHHWKILKDKFPFSKINKMHFFAGKKKIAFFLQPAEHCTCNQQITGAVSVSCRLSAKLSACTLYGQAVTREQEELMDYQSTHQYPLRTTNHQPELVGIHSQETVNEAPVWVEPHTAMFFSNWHWAWGEEPPPAITGRER